MSQERRSARGHPPAANLAPPGDAVLQDRNIVLTPKQFVRLLNIAQAANKQAAATIGNPSLPQAPAEPALFAFSPALVNMATPVDFTTSEGNKLNKASAAALPNKFDVELQCI